MVGAEQKNTSELWLGIDPSTWAKSKIVVTLVSNPRNRHHLEVRIAEEDIPTLFEEICKLGYTRLALNAGNTGNTGSGVSADDQTIKEEIDDGPCGVLF